MSSAPVLFEYNFEDEGSDNCEDEDAYSHRSRFEELYFKGTIDVPKDKSSLLTQLEWETIVYAVSLWNGIDSSVILRIS
jgi:hypothetical protein